MVSLRCKMMVEEELRKLEIAYSLIDLGMVEIAGEIYPQQREMLKNNLLKYWREIQRNQRCIRSFK